MFANLIKKRIYLFLFFLLVIPGCSLWENFTTYFNLYYNADDLFNKCENQIKEQEKDLFTTEPPAITGNVTTDLQKVIEKCSNILQFSPNSAYVDDALMMLGKSFYYQKSYLKSKKKFEELIATQPESNYLEEADLWIGKCDMRLRNFTEGLAKLDEVRKKAVEEGNDEILQDAFIEEIVYRKTIDDISGAIELANEFLDASENDEIKADVWYEVGNLNVEIGELDNAVTAYRNVFEYSPDFDLEVSSKLKLGIALRETDHADEALLIFDDMKSEDKYSDKYSDIDLQLGITQASLGNYEEAVDQLMMVDTTYKNTPNSGAAKYELASVYQHGLMRLDSAAAYYKKAATSSLPKEYIDPAKDRNALFTRYTSFRNNLNKYGKQLFYLDNPDEFKIDSVRYVEDSLAIAEEISKVRDLQEIWTGLDTLMRGKQDTTGFYQDSSKVVDTLYTILKDSLQYVNRDSIFSWIRKPKPEDSLLVFKFDSMLTNRTFDPNAKQKLEEEKRERETFATQLVASLPDTLKFKNNPPKRPKISEDSLKTIIAKNQLDLGNLFLAELNFPDSSFSYYTSNINDYPNTPYFATTLFALGSYYLTVNKTNEADSLFNIIYDNYKNESVVNAAADKLN
ncbi:MAG: tetratricopeptide repeat protein, partial [Ignavibacteriaceae bacterium]